MDVNVWWRRKREGGNDDTPINVRRRVWLFTEAEGAAYQQQQQEHEICHCKRFKTWNATSNNIRYAKVKNRVPLDCFQFYTIGLLLRFVFYILYRLYGTVLYRTVPYRAVPYGTGTEGTCGLHKSHY